MDKWPSWVKTLVLLILGWAIKELEEQTDGRK